MRVVFAGTPSFALPCLRVLVESDCDILAVLTQPDRPAGRGRALRASPVKQLALEAGIPVDQPARLSDVAERLAAMHLDLIVVVAYGLIVPETVLATPALGCVNVHASLLPRWRGAAPIPRAIEAGDAESGITLMQMDHALDTGAILAQRSISVYPTDTAGTLHDRLAELGAELLRASLPALERGELRPRPQTEAHASYAARLSKSEARIDWRLPADVIERKVRALNPWPVAYTEHRDVRLRILRASVRDETGDVPPGTVIWAGRHGVAVQTGSTTLVAETLQRAGGKPLPADAFLNGYTLGSGDRLTVNG